MKPTDDYIFMQPEPYRSILLHIITVVNHTVPEAILEFKYGVPYFYLKNKPLCYLTLNKKNKYVDVGFARGFKLTNHFDLLVSKNRNTVKSLRYFSLEEIDNRILGDVLSESAELYK